MNKQFVIVLVVLFAVFGGIIVSQKKESTDSDTNSSGQPTSHYYGINPEESEDPESVVNLTEYGDFQCPACASYHPIVKQIKEKYKDQITFQFKNFPIVAIHPNAMAAHRAAEAASLQGKFWEMHDLIYEQQQTWASGNNAAGTFRSFAESLGLNMEQFDTDISSREVNTAIQDDIKAGEALNIQGTPGFVIDGKLIENPKSIEEFEQLIQDAIAAKTTS